MSTPFEIFRTPIQLRTNVNGSFVNGLWVDGSIAQLSAILVTGNVINITLNGIPLAPITFITSSQNTLVLIQAALSAQPNINYVTLTGTNNLKITIVPVIPNLSVINSFTITGGASQASATITNSPIIGSITASIQPVSGEEMLSIPEARREREIYKMFTSYAIQTVGTQNPQQVMFFGKIFEVYEVKPWQNTPVLTLVQNYCYYVMRLQPLAP